MPATIQDKLATGLLLRGFKEVRRTGRYRKFETGLPIRQPADARHRFVLLGSSGAMRLTDGSIANSFSITGTDHYRQVLAEGAEKVGRVVTAAALDA